MTFVTTAARERPAADPPRPGAADTLPLCVDLDGTLLRVDTLHESAVAVICSDLRAALHVPAWLARGRAVLKRELAKRWRFNPADLPYNAEVLAYVAAERARGRRVVLATAADETIANAIAAHAGFDAVIASDGSSNLKGSAKAEELRRRFGRGGFVYAGNDASDLKVWESSAAAIVVNAPARIVRQVRGQRDALVLDDRGSKIRALVKAMRPYQWVKNLLTAVPLIGSWQFSQPGAWARTLAVFVAFCAIASALYIVNDLSDLAADRAHPRKRRRPFASGALSIVDGLAIVPLLLAGGAVFAIFSGAPFVVLGYAVLSASYSFVLKEQPLVDVFALAALYTIRLFAGATASGHPVSLWLLAFSGFTFLSLALIKRVSELMRVASTEAPNLARRGYSRQDLSVLQMLGCAAAFSSALVLALYVQSDIATKTYGQPTLLWSMVPLLLFWQCRLWLSTSRGYMHDDPIVYAVRDWVSWAVLALLAVIVLAAHAIS